MPTALFNVSTLAVLAVAVVLLLGLRSMMKGDSSSASQNLMRWRVGLQFVAILVIMLSLYVTRG